MPVPQYTTQLVQTNVDERKLTKIRMLKNKQFYFITTGRITNTKVVRFINLYRGVCLYVKARIFLVKNNSDKEGDQLVLTYMCMCAGMCEFWYV